MINVTIDRIEYKVTMKGHADYAELGKDIVCSAMSILFFSLAHTLEDNTDKLLGGVALSENNGEITISACPQEGYASIIGAVYEMFTTGTRLLHENYPNNVHLTVRGECAL